MMKTPLCLFVIVLSFSVRTAQSQYPQYAPKEILIPAIAVVSHFENGSGDPYLGITLDFDGQGLSLGLLQWNINQRSLQPLVRNLGKANVLKTMPTYGEDFWNACTSSKDEGLRIVRKWQNITLATKQHDRSAHWKPEYLEVKQELLALLGSKTMRALQDDQAKVDSEQAWKEACNWAQAQRGRGELPTNREFTAFLDTIAHSGGMAGLSHRDVLRWRRYHASYKHPSQLASNWLYLIHKPQWQVADANKNSEIWQTTFPEQYEDLMLLCWLRAQESYGSWGYAQGVALCRRGTILANNGWVNGQPQSFPQLTEAPANGSANGGASNSTARLITQVDPP
jgi:hypothetical protein